MDEVGYLVIYGVRKRDGWGVWVRRGGRGNGIICASNMSGEMHMRRRRDAKMRYSAAYPSGAER